MDFTEGDAFLAWKRKRRKSFIGFIIVGIVGGIDCSVIFSTIYAYLTDLIKTDKAELYYGLIIACFYLSSALSATMSGRWLDNTRKVRLLINIILLLQIVGFLLYSIPYHAAIILVARFICGIGEPFPSIITGEIFRIYDENDSTRAILWIASIYSFGFIIGPSLNFLFKDVEFKIGSMEVNNLNFVGIFMAVLLLIVMVITNFLVHDCSAEFDLKEYLKKTKNERRKSEYEFISGQSHDETTPDMIVASETDGLISKPLHEVIPVKVVFRSLLSNTDTTLIFAMTFIFVYSVFSASILLPMIADIFLKWNVTSISYLYVGIGISDFLLLLFLYKCCDSSRFVYRTSILSISSQLVVYCILIFFKVLTRHFVRDVIMIVLYPMLLTLGWTFDNVLMRLMLAKMVPSSVQSFNEGLRSAVSKFALIVGSLTAPLMLPWLQWWSGGILFLMLPMFIAFIIRRKQLSDPKEIDFSYAISCSSRDSSHTSEGTA